MYMTERERGGILKKARLTKNSSYMQHFHLLLFIFKNLYFNQRFPGKHKPSRGSHPDPSPF